MWVGISKSLGNGYRVAAGTSVGKSAAAERAERDLKFVRECERRIRMSIWRHALSHGVCVTGADVFSASASDLQYDVEKVEPLMEKIGEAIALFSDTGKINQAQKERLLKAIYALERYLEEARGDSELAAALQGADVIAAARKRRSRWNWLLIPLLSILALAFLASSLTMLASWLDGKTSVNWAIGLGFCFLIAARGVYLRLRFGADTLRRQDRAALSELADKTATRILSSPAMVAEEIRRNA
jgi:hypothetical protein